jgi:putative peptidoglycan lipid II flippase
MGPRVIGQAAAHVSILVTFTLAARLDDGGAKVAGLGYAYQLMLLPYGIFSLSLSQVAFPRLARLVAEGRTAELAADVRRTLGTILWLTLPSAAALLVLGFAATRIFFQRGAFDDLSLQYTVGALVGYAAALPAFAASEILIRSFYAMQRTWTPVLVGLLQVALNLALGAALLGLGGDIWALALVFSLANTMEAILLFALLGAALPGIWRDGPFWRTALGSAAAALVCGLGLAALRGLSLPLVPALSATASYVWTRDLPGLLLWCVCALALGAAAYLLLTALMGASPAAALLRRLRQK